jgi:MATE family multidrug resistance protein
MCDIVCVRMRFAAIAGLISIPAQAAQATLSTFAGVCFMAPLSISIAAAVRIGHHLGDGDVPAAKHAMRVVAKLTFLYLGINICLIMATRQMWIRLYTDDPEVIREAVAVHWMLAVYSSFDAIQGLLSGILRGMRSV